MRRFEIALALAYPVLIYLSITRFEPRAVAAIGAALLVARAAFAVRGRATELIRALAAPGAAVVLALALAALWNHPLALLLAPAGVSFALLAVFARSLQRPPSLVERLALLLAPDLSPDELAYCRRVTALWCGFFLANGVVIAGLALYASLATWALYSGLVSYLLIGLLFAGEYVYRHWRFRRYLGAPMDALLRRLFPPPAIPR